MSKNRQDVPMKCQYIPMKSPMETVYRITTLYPIEWRCFHGNLMEIPMIQWIGLGEILQEPPHI